MNTIESSKTLLHFFALAILLVLPNPAAAQQDPRETTSKAQAEAEKRQDLEKKTHALLNDIASAAWGLKLPENRIFVMASAADLLWTFDEKRARSVYWEAVNALNLLAPQARRSGETLSNDEKSKLLQSYLSLYGLRRNLLRQAAKRDAQLALDMLRATRQVPPRELRPGYHVPDERQLEQEIASEVAARDPADGLQLARESLGKGFTFELVNFIRRLNQKDPAKASEFAGEVISKLRMTNVAADIRASTVAIQLIEYSRKPDPNGRFAKFSESVKILHLTDDQRRDLVEIITNAALSASANSNLLFDLPQVRHEIQQFFPGRQAALEQKLAMFNRTLAKRERDRNGLIELLRRGNPEEIVRRAASASAEERLSLYRQAAISAVSRGTTDSFRELVSKEIKDEDEQQKVLDVLDAEQISVAANRKQIDELKNLFPKIRRKEERARAMVEVAMILKEQGEDAEAVSLLDEAATLIKTDLNSETQTNALLTLMSAYAFIDPPKAFVLAERTVDQANSQISMLLLVDRVVSSGAVKKGEILLERAGIMPLDLLVFKYGKGVGALAAVDFNRTKALADRFDRSELRIMARLLIARGILNPTPPSQN